MICRLFEDKRKTSPVFLSFLIDVFSSKPAIFVDKTELMLNFIYTIQENRSYQNKTHKHVQTCPDLSRLVQTCPDPMKKQSVYKKKIHHHPILKKNSVLFLNITSTKYYTTYIPKQNKKQEQQISPISSTSSAT